MPSAVTSRLAGGVASALAAVLLAACTGAPASAPTNSPTTTPPPSVPVQVNARAFAPGLLPADVEDPDTERIARLLFRGLVRYDVKGMAVEEVAESIETADDTVFTVRVAPGWTFTDGEAVTARSFVDAWNWAARRGNGQYRANAFSDIVGYADLRSPDSGRTSDLAGLSLIDDRTFRITLIEPQPGYVERLGDVAFAPLPSSALRDPQGFARRPVGNGPYLLDEPWSTSSLTLRPSSSYAGTDTAQNAGVVFTAYADLADAAAAFDAGRLDVLDDVPADRLATYRGDLGPRAVNQPVGRAQAIVVPLTREPWTGSAGLARRRAISLAVDREEITGSVLAGTTLPATDLAAPVVAGSSDDLCDGLCRHDERAARAAAQQAGGLTGPLRIAYNADDGHRPWLDQVCADVTETLGIGCEPVSYPTLLALHEAIALGTETNPYVETWQMSRPALAAFLEPRFTAGAPQNGSGYADDLTQTQLDTASTAPVSEQPAAYAEVEERIIAALPVLPLWSVNATMVSGTGVGPVRADVFGSPVYTEISRPGQSARDG